MSNPTMTPTDTAARMEAFVMQVAEWSGDNSEYTDSELADTLKSFAKTADWLVTRARGGAQ